MSDELRFRSNVTIIASDADRARARRSIPGEVATDLFSTHLLTETQLRERALYSACTLCNRSLWRINRQGCERNCEARVRAAALDDPLRTYKQALTRLAEDGAVPFGDTPDTGRGRIRPIPEWEPPSPR